MEKAKSLIKGKALVYVTPSMTVTEAADLMSKAKIGAVVVLDNTKLCGIFTERDLLNRVIVAGKNAQSTKISEVMTRNVVVADSGETYEACLEKMRKVGCRHLPVVENDRLLGMISIRDLLMHDIEVKSAEIKMMNYLYYYSPPTMEE